MTKRKETPTMVQRTFDGVLFMGVDFYPCERYAAFTAALARAQGATVRTFRNKAQGHTVLMVPAAEYDEAFDMIRKAEDNIDYKVANTIPALPAEGWRGVLKGFVEGFKEQLASVGA